MMKRNTNPNQGQLFADRRPDCPFAAAAARVRNDVEPLPLEAAIEALERKTTLYTAPEAYTPRLSEEDIAMQEPVALAARKAERADDSLALQKPAYVRKAERRTEVAKKRRAPGAGRKTLDNGKTIRRPISIPAALWHTIQVSSDAQGITASEFIRRAVAGSISAT